MIPVLDEGNATDIRLVENTDNHITFRSRHNEEQGMKVEESLITYATIDHSLWKLVPTPCAYPKRAFAFKYDHDPDLYLMEDAAQLKGAA